METTVVEGATEAPLQPTEASVDPTGAPKSKRGGRRKRAAGSPAAPRRARKKAAFMVEIEQHIDIPAEGKAAGPPAPGRRYVIEKVSIRGARVTMTTAGLKGQGIGFTLPDIELRNIGQRPEGVTAAQAANVVTNALISKIAQRVITNLDVLRKGGKDAAIDALKNLLR